MTLQRNISQSERLLRILGGVFLLVYAGLSNSEWRWIGLLGIIPLMTGLAGWCPLYRLVGVGVRRKGA